MLRNALRTLAAQRMRLALTVLAIVFGVAFVAGVLTLKDTITEAAATSAADDFAGVGVGVRADSEHVAGDPAALGPRLVERLRGLPGVAAVRGSVTGPAVVVDRDGDLVGRVEESAGTNYAPGPQGSDPLYRLAQGRAPSAAGEVALDEAGARTAGYRIGDRLRVVAGGGTLDATLVGTVHAVDARIRLGATLTLFDTPTAQRLFGAPDTYDLITVTARPGTSDAALLDAVRPLVPAGSEAVTGAALTAERRDLASAGTAGLATGLLVFAGIALFVGTFIITNTFTMLIGRRTRELALLRAVGATRRQVTRSVRLEALITGLVGALLGLLLGIALSTGLLALLRDTDAAPPRGPLVVRPGTILWSLVVGIGVTVAAAWLPTRKVARIAPMAALRANPPSPAGLFRRNLAGLLLIGVGVGGGYATVRAAPGGNGEPVLVTVCGVVAVTGVLMLIPLLSVGVIGALARPLTRVFGVTGTLASRNALRDPRRTAATASALMVGLFLVTGLTVIGASLKDSLDHAAARGLTADYAVSTTLRDPMAASTVDRIGRLPHVEAASVYRTATARIGDTEQEVAALDPVAGPKVLRLDFVAGGPEALGTDLLVERVEAESRGLGVGATVPVTYPDGTSGTLRVGGIYRANPIVLPYTVSTRTLDPHLERPVGRQVFVKSAPGEARALEATLKDAFGADPALRVQSKDELRRGLGAAIDLLLNIVYGLLAMAVLIAVIGIVNTLAMSVLERTREIGLLRAIGLDARRVRALIRLEAALISLFGALLGVGLGTTVGVLAVRGIDLGNVPLGATIPWPRIALFVLGALGVGLLAAAWPARRAARMSVLGALGSE
ncbi:ABC transporter permease [Embleya hyalina]|uniref:ABC transporter n=1 Tax=Embleya hyalina TaxID=516124 RepID=A0A401YXV5_9ACTN|nr:ABC transporter permease [Embleya hyalina]GCD99413.1 ABC transporter [Embleya hyalina]